MKKLFIAAFILALACSLPLSAAEKRAPVPSGGQSAGSNAGKDATPVDKTIKKESRQPMNMDEPMPTGMAKEGMKKGDVKARALKKGAAMDEMMKQEEMKQ